ncbi:hypothetical protein RE476_00960 [Methanolobus mangrovi]|uniref:Uncharacterized protein n=1 Tax=Methanolobus mangrovi TaxID=3072977 RepID=A0AA51UG94_9EURY|nr:hypothetical protein [Methanolobus mangrovi]WMW22418.1 hypothetical protein RE476_00960 [Methanolobus mangrovi]
MNMSTNNEVDDTDNIINEVDFDTEVITYLNYVGHIRRKELVNDLMSEHKDERGYSQKSIDRKLGILVKTGQIKVLKEPEELERYGIDREDGKASYLVSKRTSELKEYLDNMIDLLKNGDDIEKREALVELDTFKNSYVLDSVQLDLLVQSLDTTNKKLIMQIINILYEYIDKRRRDPLNRDTFIEKLRDLLTRYPERENNNDHLRTALIHLLGYYNDQSVIDQLMKDVNTLDNLSSVQPDYETWYTATILESNRELLFDIITKLRRDKREKEATFLSSIRHKARVHLGMV